jgi:hypothetical protein
MSAQPPTLGLVSSTPWRQRPDPRISLAELRLDGGHYRYATHYTAEVFRTDHPWPLVINLPALSERWATLLDIAGQPIDE